MNWGPHHKLGGKANVTEYRSIPARSPGLELAVAHEWKLLGHWLQWKVVSSCHQVHADRSQQAHSRQEGVPSRRQESALMTTIAIAVLSVVVLGALLKGVITLLWAKSDKGQAQGRGHELGWW